MQFPRPYTKIERQGLNHHDQFRGSDNRMSAVQRSKVIQLQLTGLLGNIQTEFLKLLGQGSTPLPTDASFISLQSKISSWRMRLERMSKQMQNMQKSLDSEGQRVRRLPREIRYSPSQSVRDRQKYVTQVQQMLNMVADELANLWISLTSPSDADLINAACNDIGSYLEEMQDLEKLGVHYKEQGLTEVQLVITEAQERFIQAPQQPGVNSIAMLIVLLRVFQIVMLSLSTRKK